MDSIQKDENIYKESKIKEKNKQYIMCSEIENCDSSNRIKKCNNSSVRNIRLNKNIDNNKMEEHYKEIFYIDCLCLDKWEEKNNKYRGKKKGKLKGKKILK